MLADGGRAAAGREPFRSRRRIPDYYCRPCLLQSVRQVKAFRSSRSTARGHCHEILTAAAILGHIVACTGVESSCVQCVEYATVLGSFFNVVTIDRCNKLACSGTAYVISRLLLLLMLPMSCVELKFTFNGNFPIRGCLSDKKNTDFVASIKLKYYLHHLSFVLSITRP